MRAYFVLPCLFLIVSIAGCAPKNAPPPPLAKVSGKVTVDGRAMSTGNVFFFVPGEGPKIFAITEGQFSGEAFVGKNRVEVVLEKDGPPATTDKKQPTKINAIAPKPLEAEVTKDGANAFTFEVESAK